MTYITIASSSMEETAEGRCSDVLSHATYQLKSKHKVGYSSVWETEWYQLQFREGEDAFCVLFIPCVYYNNYTV